METIAAADAKTNFGALLDKAQRGPVTISKNGRAVAVLMSAEAYREQQQLKVSRFELATRAHTDLLDIVRYTYQAGGAAQAQSHREELELALQQLGLTPDLGHRREAIAPGLRSFTVAQHVAFYIQRKDRIVVLRILHPCMNVDDAFEGCA
jgi:toxin ParE1/3/4